jgi:hypothetical protein
MDEGNRLGDQTSNHLIWQPVFREGFCVCGKLEGFKDAPELKRGMSAAHYFPDDARFSMNPEFPKDIKLGDCIDNRGGFLLVSKPFKEMIETADVRNVEYLRVTILNHKGRVASNSYFIINPLSVFEAIDLERSIIRWNNIDPELISSCDRLVLDGDKIPPDAAMWRLKSLPTHVMVRRDLVEEIQAKGFSGVAFTEVKDFSGF